MRTPALAAVLTAAVLMPALTAATTPVLAQDHPGPPEADPAAQVAELNAAYQADLQDFYAALRAEDPAERPDWSEHPAGEYLPKMVALAEKHPGTDAALNAWGHVLTLAGQAPDGAAAADNAVQALVRDHVKSAALANVIPRMVGWADVAPDRREALDTIIEQSPHDEVRAAALFTLANALNNQASRGSTEVPAEVGDMLKRVRDEFGETGWAERAEAVLFEVEHLQIGMTVPEIEAPDLQGEPFKLSDYRGKVVVLDFWGFW